MTGENSVGLSDGSDAYARQVETPNDTINSTSALIEQIRDWHSDVPAPMRDAHRWLVWRREPNDTPGKKSRKVPYYPNGQHRSGKLDTPEDIANLGTFDEALSILATGRYSGLGFALGPDGTGQYWQGIDLDGTTTRPELAQLADDLPGYTEDSPSQAGQHAIGYGRLFTSPARYHSPPSVMKKSRRVMHGWGPRIEHTPPAVLGGDGGRGDVSPSGSNLTLGAHV